MFSMNFYKKLKDKKHYSITIYSFLSILILSYLFLFFKKDSDNLSSIFYILLFLFTYITGFVSNKNKNISFLFYILALLFVLSEFVTKRMTGFYFSEIPYEIISILYDTNIDEMNSSINFDKKEIIAIFLIGTCIVSIFIKNITKEIKKYSYPVLFLQILVISMFFSFTNNPLTRAIEIIKEKDKILSDTIETLKERKKFTWGAKSLIPEKQTVVLFLGETHRGDFLGFNGYDKDTTPLLDKENIISFNNAISQAAYTLRSTPMILSRKNVNNNEGVFNEKSIIAAFREAGFETWYISYASPALIGDNEINIIVNEADHYIRSDVNTDTLKKVLTNKSNKKLIVYKTVGSHFLYHTRYPVEYDIFKPSFTNSDYKTPSINDVERLKNSYANSIRYSVDKQVSDFIDVLKNESGIVSLSFISDHGTAIYDDGKSLYGGNTKGNYSIGLFFWFNDEYKNKFNKDISLLESNKNKKITSEYFVDTMLHIGKIETNIKKGCSLFDKNLKEKERLVKNKNIYNYDTDL